MARARTWRLGLNLDDFNAALAQLEGTADHADFLRGFSRGMNQGQPRKDASAAYAAGHQLGMEMRIEAEGFRESRRKAGVCGGYHTHATQKVPHGIPHGTPEGIPLGVGEVYPSHKPLTTSKEKVKEKSKESVASGSMLKAEKILQEWNDLARRVGFHQSRGGGPVLKTLQMKVKDETWVEAFRGCFPFLEGSPFYRGENDRGWKASLEWLLRPGKVESLTGREPEKPKNGHAPEHRKSADEALLAQLKAQGIA